MLHFFGEWIEDELVSTKMRSLSMDNVPDKVSSYFTKWSANIIEYVSTIGNQICLSDLTIQHLASFNGHRGGKGYLGKHQTTEHRANISMSLSGKVFTGHRVQTTDHRANISMVLVQVDEWIDNIARAKRFINTKGRMPSQRAGDAEERRRGQWIAKFKHKEGGTNSEREKLMRREISLAFENYIRRVPVQVGMWMDNLASAKTFIDLERRMPKSNASDADERRLGQ